MADNDRARSPVIDLSNDSENSRSSSGSGDGVSASDNDSDSGSGSDDDFGGSESGSEPPRKAVGD